MAGPNGNGRGRPKRAVDEKIVYKLACIGCTYDEISTITGVARATLNERFSERIKKGHERMKRSLRRAQLKRALEGSDTMLIWLGKNQLGQTDRTESTGTLEVTVNHRTMLNAVERADRELARN